jgi:hypothetical protein
MRRRKDRRKKRWRRKRRKKNEMENEQEDLGRTNCLLSLIRHRPH